MANSSPLKTPCGSSVAEKMIINDDDMRMGSTVGRLMRGQPLPEET